MSDKRALLEQIAQSENALCGNYDFPHNTYREFMTRRDDELLRYCLSHNVRFRNYDSILYGLEPMLIHYKEQVIIGDSFYETKIPVKQALAINEQGKSVTCSEAAELTVGVNDKGLNDIYFEPVDIWSGSRATTYPNGYMS